MTRFARAKGSKASNERVPEESTPWSEMKQQLLDKNKEIAESKNRQAFIDQRSENYKAFLEEKEAEDSKKSQWAEFPMENLQKKSVPVQRKKSFPKVADRDDELSDNNEAFVALKAKVDKVLSQPEHSKRNSEDNDDSDDPPEEHSSKIEVIVPPPKVKKSKKKKLSITIDSNNTNNERKGEETKKNPVKRKNDASNEKKTKLKKMKFGEKGETDNVNTMVNKKAKLSKPKGTNQPKKIIKENLTEQELKKIEKKKQKRIKQLEKKKRAKAELKKQKEEEEKKKLETGETTISSEVPPDAALNNKNIIKRKFNSQEKSKDFKSKFEKPNKFNDKKIDKKSMKSKDGKEHARKKPLLPSKMFINGKEMEIDYVDGFPVKKEDAARLNKLRRQMISKGLPRSEINVALKLERRKAEKALTREKKKVCFNCRKSGHNLSECPELDKDQMAQPSSGICFKCGSTEHTHFECKVVRGQEFKYAQCFVCNEPGHIARQCPDNARGLYPKGGACNVCGDVTHLKRDCPKYQAQQHHLQSSLNVQTIGGSNPDVLDETNYNNNNNVGLGNKTPNKIIKF